LSGKVLDQIDLFIAERSHLLAVDADCANQFVILEHRNGDHGARAG
jgi:hypothetical protein